MMDVMVRLVIRLNDRVNVKLNQTKIRDHIKGCFGEKGINALYELAVLGIDIMEAKSVTFPKVRRTK